MLFLHDDSTLNPVSSSQPQLRPTYRQIARHTKFMQGSRGLSIDPACPIAVEL